MLFPQKSLVYNVTFILLLAVISFLFVAILTTVQENNMKGTVDRDCDSTVLESKSYVSCLKNKLSN